MIGPAEGPVLELEPEQVLAVEVAAEPVTEEQLALAAKHLDEDLRHLHLDSDSAFLEAVEATDCPTPRRLS